MVRKKAVYAVRISGLGEGLHDFSFELDDAFFALFEQAEISHGRLNATVVLEKKAGAMALHFSLKGEVEVCCDRCLGSFMAPVENEQRIFVRSGEDVGELDDEVMVIHPDDHEIDVTQLLYEFTVLALPVQRIHPEDENGLPGCDPEMLRRLEAHSARHEKEEIETDPRWDALKGIKG